tara:strand:- start:226 stop:1125 length:900 start_codon:yes stop_codon:yes gene_type:complete
MSNKEWFLIILLGVIWGSSFLFSEILLKKIDVLMIIFLRVSFGGVFLIILCFFKKIEFNITLKQFIDIIIMSVLNNIIPFTLIVYGQKFVTGGFASIINSSTSFFSILLASFYISNERLSLNRVTGVLVGIIGVIISVGYDQITDLSNSNLGVFLILLATISYAFAGIFAKIKLKLINPLVSATGMTVLSSLFLLPIIIIFQHSQFKLINFNILLYASFFGLICSGLAYFLYFKIIEITRVSNLLVCTIIIPPSAIILNFIFLNDIIKMKEIIGLIVITIGLIILDGRIFNFFFLRNNK